MIGSLSVRAGVVAVAGKLTVPFGESVCNHSSQKQYVRFGADTFAGFFIAQRKHAGKGKELSMNIIETTQLTKTFKRYKKQEGLSGSIKGLFHREYEEKEAWILPWKRAGLSA